MKKRIMLLEDDRNTLEITEEILLEEGYHPISFDHYESVGNIIDFSPELILLDIRLSGGYGHILCSQLKENPATSSIPVILVSAADKLSAIALDCHADNYLSKPYNMDTLIKMVRHYD